MDAIILLINSPYGKDNLGEGVYYSADDYAGLLSRFIIIGIDIIVLGLLSIFTAGILSVFFENYDELMNFNLYAILAVSYLYLAVMKQTDFGTIGYWAMSMKIVRINGTRPSLFQMTFRYLLLILGPFHILIDIFWLGGDDYKQTLRDKIVGTYVVRHDAFPEGRGKIILSPYYFLGWSMLFREVKRSNQY